MHLRELVDWWVTRWQTSFLVYSYVFLWFLFSLEELSITPPPTYGGQPHSAFWVLGKASPPGPIRQSSTGFYLIRVFLSQHLILLLTRLSLLYQLSDLTHYVKHPRWLLVLAEMEPVFWFFFLLDIWKYAQEETREKKYPATLIMLSPVLSFN